MFQAVDKMYRSTFNGNLYKQLLVYYEKRIELFIDFAIIITP